MPAGYRQQTMDEAYGFAVTWLDLALNDSDVHAGEFDEWVDAADPTGSGDFQQDLSERAAAYVSVFESPAKVLAPPRITGAFSVETAVFEGIPRMHLSWRGAAVFAVAAKDGSGSLVASRRLVTWTYLQDGSRHGTSAAADFDNVDPCTFDRTGRLDPRPNDVVFQDRYLTPEKDVTPDPAEVAALEAERAAC